MSRLTQFLAHRQAGHRIAFRVLIPLILATGILLASFVFAIWRLQEKQLAKDADSAVQAVQRLLHAEQNQTAALLRTTSHAIMNDEQLAGAFRRRDRTALLERATPLAAALRRELGVTHFYFHLPDRTVLLRVHDPADSGDRIDRHTLLEAEHTGRVSVGLERGLTGVFTLRVVSPWPERGQLLGYLELGVELEYIVGSVQDALSGNVDFLVAVKKTFLDRKQWSASVERKGSTVGWDRFPQLVVITKTAHTLPPVAIDYLSGANRSTGVQRKEHFELAALPLKDVTGEDVGNVLVLTDVSRQLAATRSSIRSVAVLIVAIGAAVIAFFAVFLAGIEKDLANRTNRLKDEINERSRAEEALLRKTAFLEAQVNSSLDGILVVDRDGKKTLQNKRFVDLFHLPQNIADEDTAENRFHWIKDVTTQPTQFFTRVLYLYAHPADISRDHVELKDGTVLDQYSSPVNGADGTYYGRIWAFRDITQRTLLEAQLYQAQRLETVGRLAGGIAHEFNSLLTVIIGNSELLRSDLPEGNPLAENTVAITRAAQRAATLTRQLLAYGRKQLLSPVVLNLNSVLTGLEDTLRQLMGPGTEVRIVPAAGLAAVRADASQLEQVIMNMAMNAADSMPDGGLLSLETANLTLEQQDVARLPEATPGNYVTLAITDTGAGMSEQVKARLFEPFFTTKGVGQGTGLGLSTCYGIIKQSGGCISVDSAPAYGTAFKIYLPQVEQETAIPS